MVKSAISHIEERQKIRETWGNYADKNTLSVFFIVGLPPPPKNQTEFVEEIFDESTNDIIIGDFWDTYRKEPNLTEKLKKNPFLGGRYLWFASVNAVHDNVQGLNVFHIIFRSS